ncbi:hypothetical protein ACROYT_G026530 [Oculina patagonica]
MSQYFYIVSQLNGYVLDISESKKGGDVVNYPAHGGANQLWRWDTRSRFASKLGLVLDISGGNKAPGTHCIGWDAHDGLNQKWRFEEGSIKSNLNDLVIDVAWSSVKPGASVIMWDFHGASNQKWWCVPEDAWEDFKLVQANPNPLTRAQFWKNLADNYLDVIVGYSIDDYEAKVQKTIETLDDCASQLDKVAKDTGIAETVGGGASVAGGGMAIAGLLLAPFTGGLSLGLTVAGAVTGVAGAATTLTANLINKHWDEGEQKKVKEATEPVFRATLSLQGFISEYIGKLQEAAEFLKTPEGEAIARDAYNIMDLSKEAGSIAWNTYKIGNAVVTGVQHVKQAKQIKALVDFIQADYYALNGARIGLSTHAAAPGFTIPILGKTLVAAGTTTAKVLSGSMAIVGVAFGIWDIVGGAKKIANGSELADEFRKSAKDLKAETDKLIELYKELQLSLETEEDKGTEFITAASDLLHGATPLVHRFVLGNTTETPLTMKFEAKAPFKIISTEPPPSAKTSKTQTPGSITVKPAKTLELKVGFSLSDELVRKVNDITAAQEQGDGTVLISSEDGDRKLVFQRDLKVEFSNKTTQLIPLMASIAVPTLRLSQDVLDFGTCLVGQSVEKHVTLYNPSQSASAWVVKKDPRYPSVSRDVFVVNPTEGYLEANTSFTAKTKTLLKITFTAKHNVEYECVVIVSGQLQEEEQRLVLRGRASYDERHERLVNVTTDT